MTLAEKNGDIFAAPQGYYLAHCISGDFALCYGISKKFDDVYNMRYKLFQNYPFNCGGRYNYIGKALLVDNVFNLITKARCFHKTTYDSLYEALVDMKKLCEVFNITKLAMPRIGLGRDGLRWSNVKDIISGVFEDTSIDIVIYSLK